MQKNKRLKTLAKRSKIRQFAIPPTKCAKTMSCWHPKQNESSSNRYESGTTVYVIIFHFNLCLFTVMKTSEKSRN